MATGHSSEIEAQILERAHKDAAFRAQLRRDPRAALAAFSIALPEWLELRVVEETARVRYLVLPPDVPTDELSDEELAHAAGSVDYSTFSPSGCHWSSR